MNSKGYDVSAWQTVTPSLVGFDFLIARAGYRSTGVDKMYATHSGAALRQGKVLGAYWFWYDGQDNAVAVQTFLAVADNAQFLVLDLEGTNANTDSGRAQGKDFIAKLRAADPQRRKIGLYHSASGFPTLGQDFNWVAKWSSYAPTIPWAFWQYDGSGTDGLDNNYFNGDAAALAVFMGKDTEVQLDTGIATIAMADFTPGATVYRDAARTQVFKANWAGGVGIGVVGIDEANARQFAAKNVCINLYNPDGSRALVYVGADHMVNLRDRHPEPVVGVYTQAQMDAATATIDSLSAKIAAAKTALG